MNTPSCTRRACRSCFEQWRKEWPCRSFRLAKIDKSPCSYCGTATESWFFVPLDATTTPLHSERPALDRKQGLLHIVRGPSK